MKRLSIIICVCLLGWFSLQAQTNPRGVSELLDRIGGSGTSARFVTVLDDKLSADSAECFVITSQRGKPCIKGSSMSALTAGIGWYLNHYAHQNISWNRLNECGAGAYVSLDSLPLPQKDEFHRCLAQYRYYLNYCTFGYSMATWTWLRWRKEIDWMALHGVNMPLQIIGLEEVWRRTLIQDFGYTPFSAKRFIPGPAFTAWWGMNNLEGWGGTSPTGWGGVQDDAWYDRQMRLARQIIKAEHLLGMNPVLPGFSGMVPSDFQQKTGIKSLTQGLWCGGFTRPYILDPTASGFQKVAEAYYHHLDEVMGTSCYYSMDPFHEGPDKCPVSNPDEAYCQVYKAMDAASPGSKFVIQQWQWHSFQKKALTGVPKGKLLVLDLFSDGRPGFDHYGSPNSPCTEQLGYYPQPSIFCAIPNYGGRSGMFGRLDNLTHNYFHYRKKYPSIDGIGAAPEAIEQTPVTYDLLFELPWMEREPDVKAWVRDYATARYGVENKALQQAWELLRQSVLSFGVDGIQGPIEDVWAARPNLKGKPASSWGVTIANCKKTYTQQKREMLKKALILLLSQSPRLEHNSNYNYDLIEVCSAVLADYAYDLLLSIGKACDEGSSYQVRSRSTRFLQLILDVDSLKGTNVNFRLGRWTSEARQAALEINGATTATADWYEFNNARTLVSTWGPYDASCLLDYSYRSWQGQMRDLYYPRWQYFFQHNGTNSAGGFFQTEWDWAHDPSYTYSPIPQGNTVLLCRQLIEKYLN